MTPPQRHGLRARTPLATLALTLFVAAGCADAGPAAPTETRALHEATDATIGAASTADGYTSDSPVTSLGGDQQYHFRIVGPDGRPQTSYVQDGTTTVQLHAVRDDLASYVHVRPTMSPDGTWSARLPLRIPGPYHVYASALLRDAGSGLHELVLSRPLMVPGPYQLWQELPDPSTAAQVDNYAIAFDAVPRPWKVTPLGARVTRSGQPVSDLEPLAGVYAQVAAFRWPGHLFAHAEPLDRAVGGHAGGPSLTFDVEFPGAGDYRVFVEFVSAGKLRTAALTMRVE